MSIERWIRRVILFSLLITMALPMLQPAAQAQDDSTVPAAGDETLLPTEIPGSDEPLPTAEIPEPYDPGLPSASQGPGSGVEEPLVVQASIILPSLVSIDPTATGWSDNPCTLTNASWGHIRVSPVVTSAWASGPRPSGTLMVDTSLDPDVINWTTANAGDVLAAIVADQGSTSGTAANLYDYQTAQMLLLEDYGLRAPNTDPGTVYFCVPQSLLPAPTVTATIEPTATWTPEPTSTDTPAPTATDVPTNTPTATNTAVPTDTPTTTQTAVPTNTPTATHTPTATQTSTHTATATATRTPSATATVTLTATSTIAPSSTPGGPIGNGDTVRTTANLNLRSSPSTSGNVIAVMVSGTSATVIGGPQNVDGYTWWRLSSSYGTGWAVSLYLQKTGNAPTPTPSSTLAATSTTVPSTAIAPGDTVRTSVNLNLRSSYSTGSTIITVLPAGTTGTVLEGPQSGSGYTWWRVTAPQGTGWVVAQYLEKTASGPTATPTRTPTSTATAAGTSTASATATNQPGISVGDTVRATANVNLRSSWSTAASVITVLSTGTQGTVIGGPQTGSGYTWWQLSTSAGTGWAAASFLEEVGPAPTPTRTPTAGPTPASCGPFFVGDVVRVTTDGLNLRSSASTSATIVAVLPNGTRGAVVGGPASANGYTWCRLQTSLGTGWAVTEFLAKVSGTIPTPSGTQTPRPNPPSDPGGGMSALIYSGSKGSGEIALTFDAGADRGRAATILDTLAAYGVKATFGLTGQWAQANPDLVQRMVHEGHQLINHTWSHPSFTGGSSSTTVLTRAGRVDQLTRTEDFIRSQTGYVMKPNWRPPYGDINTSVRQDVYSAGYYLTIMWSCDTLAWNGATEARILNRCMNPMGARDIILMHVGGGLDWAATDNMIEHFLGRGLTLVTLEELLS